MGRAFDEITEPMKNFIAPQHMFFVATAPRADVGRVNMSPKGDDSLRLIDSRNVSCVDLTGSGAETIAHLREKRSDHVHVLRLRRQAEHRAVVRDRPRRACGRFRVA